MYCGKLVRTPDDEQQSEVTMMQVSAGSAVPAQV